MESYDLQDMEAVVTREIRLADSIRNDYVADASINKRTEEIKETKQREEHVEQPKF